MNHLHGCGEDELFCWLREAVRGYEKAALEAIGQLGGRASIGKTGAA
jgi:hypothetical protein